MIHPMFTRLATQPGLFAEHAGAYVELACAEAGVLGRRWLRRGVLLALGVAMALLAIGLAGVALLLAAALPAETMPARWALWVVPGGALALSVLCVLQAQRTTGGAAFGQLKRQLEADAQLLDEMEAT